MSRVRTSANFKMFPVLLLLLSAVITECHHSDEKVFKGKIADLIRTATWQPLTSQADLGGSLILTVLRKYKIPVKARLHGSSSTHKARSCKVIKEANPKSQDGVYTIYPDGGTATRVYCDMTTDGGGWTVFQRRINGKVDFYKNWGSYKKGFGDPAKEYWLGNDVLHELTSLGTCTLRIDMTSVKGDTGYAVYSNFTIKSENQAYQMDYGKYLGTVGDALYYHQGQKFTTPDRDNDTHTKMHCSSFRHGSWWYNQCALANLNGQYGVSSTKGMMWHPWKSKGQTMYINMSKMMVKC